MSLNYYGQPSYAATAYPQPPMQGGFHYQYQQSAPPPPPPAPPAPVYYMDPGTFRRDYSSRLAELTVNSRPIIQNLSMLAHEYTRFADIVSQCLEAHIRRVSLVSYLMTAAPFAVTGLWYSSGSGISYAISFVMYTSIVLCVEKRS